MAPISPVTLFTSLERSVLSSYEETSLSKQEEVADWIYKHPKIVKTAEIAGMILGVGSLVLLPFSFPVLGVGAVVLAVSGGIVALVSSVAYQLLGIVISPHHSMQQHIFEPASYGVGKLYYQGDIPILELQSDDPYQAGLAHGYLLGKSLDRLLYQLNWVKKFAHSPLAAEVPETIHAIRRVLPPEYVEELQGTVDGFNQWSKEHRWFGAKTLTIEDLILFHLMPDGLHFSPRHFEAKKSASLDLSTPLQSNERIPFLGCTVVIDQDGEKGMIFGRNMDWPSFGVFGTYSVVMNRKHQDPKLSTVELGFPGFIGTLTGMNKAGLSLAMNVCSGNTHSVQGMPAAFFNRFCLENCHDLLEIERQIEQNPPLGSYHLSVADQDSAKSFHFYQGMRDDHVTREWQTGQPLITTNCQYPSEQEEDGDMHCSQQRKQIIQDLFSRTQTAIAADQIKIATLVQASLALPFVNNILTTHKIIMQPQSKKIQLAVDNAFAGQANLQELDTTSLLS